MKQKQVSRMVCSAILISTFSCALPCNPYKELWQNTSGGLLVNQYIVGVKKCIFFRFFPKLTNTVCCSNHSRISLVARVLDCRAEGCGFDSWGHTNTQGLKITEK